MAGVMVHHLKGSHAILQPLPAEDGMGGPQLVAATFTQGRELPLQGLELGIKADVYQSGLPTKTGNYCL